MNGFLIGVLACSLAGIALAAMWILAGSESSERRR
jgi:hypothetical protein